MRFFRAGGEKGDQVQQRITGANDAGEAGFREPELGQEFILLGIAELRQFGFDGG
jgi:hypothetical protein